MEKNKEIISLKKVICPECEGDKVKLYLDEFDEKEQRECKLCEGEGIVFEVIKRTLKPINDGR